MKLKQINKTMWCPNCAQDWVKKFVTGFNDDRSCQNYIWLCNNCGAEFEEVD